MSPQEIIKQYVSQRYYPSIHNRAITFEVSPEEIAAVCKELADALPFKTMYATDERVTEQVFKVWYVFTVPKEQYAIIPFLKVDGTSYPSLASHVYATSLFEREIATFFGLTAVGHPDPRPILLHHNWPADLYPLRKDFEWNHRPETAQEEYLFKKIEGEGLYELPVGPVHAGIIEPGHFRFTLAGEEIINLETRLGYIHRGVEKLFETLPLEQKVKLSERVSGDSSFNHSLAFCEAVETLGSVDTPERARHLRVVYAEMERIANHFNDIGFIMLDTGFNFGGSQCARIRERVMQWHELLSGNRYLRGVNTIGGVTTDIAQKMATDLHTDLSDIERDFNEVMDIADKSLGLFNRLEATGVLQPEAAAAHAGVGIAARALGIPMDARVDYPYAAYNHFEVPVATSSGGDVLARFRVRVQEVRNSIRIAQQVLTALPQGPLTANVSSLALQPNSVTVSIVEGWRGDIVYVVKTDNAGALDRVHVRDASVMNWFVAPEAIKGNVVPDFPLINKSFNLSYAGNDR